METYQNIEKLIIETDEIKKNISNCKTVYYLCISISAVETFLTSMGIYLAQNSLINLSKQDDMGGYGCIALSIVFGISTALLLSTARDHKNMIPDLEAQLIENEYR